MLKTKLAINQQQSILYELFEFVLTDKTLGNGEKQWVLYDDEGKEFYRIDEHLQFYFSTFEGIIKYATYRGKKEGYWRCQQDIKNALGI